MDMENEQTDIKDDKQTSIKQIWLDFGASATVHGFPFAFSARGIYRTALWVALSFTCLGLLLYVMTELTLIYFTYPVNTKKMWLHATEVTFPAVTVCNTNPVKQSLLHLSAEVSALGSGRRRRRRQSDSEDPLLRYRRSTASCTSAENTETGTCYWYDSNVYSWDDAQAHCESGGGNLAHIKTQATHDFLESEGLIGDDDLWISLNDIVTEDTYLWGDGDSLVWTNWKNGQPNGANDECVIINDRGDPEWEDHECDSQYGVLCESGSTDTAQTTLTPTTVVPTTVAPTTVAPTTVAPTTVAPTTVASTTFAPTTFAPTTVAPATIDPTTVAPTTIAPTTADQTTVAPITDDVTTEQGPHSTPVPQFLSQYAEREPYREDFLQETEFLEALADTPEEVKQQMGYQQREFVLQCTFAGESCRQNDFSTFFNAMHGNCYTFNSGWDPHSGDLYSTSRPGANTGLELLLNINQAEYLVDNDMGAGAIVVIHPANRMPFPEDEGRFALPGRMTSFEIKEINSTRLPHPHGKCVTSQKSNKNINVFEERLPVEYSALACYKTCYQGYIIKECGCADPMFPMRGRAFSRFEGRACDIRNIVQDDCMYGVQLRYIQNDLKCDCEQVCSDLFYPTSNSIAAWPSRVEFNTVENYLETVHNISLTNDSAEFIAKNIIKIRVYFRELNSEQTVEFPKYNEGKLLTSFAGSIGLFLGCTVFSVLEPFILLFNIMVALFRKHTNKNKTKDGQFDDLDTIANSDKMKNEPKIAWN